MNNTLGYNQFPERNAHCLSTNGDSESMSKGESILHIPTREWYLSLIDNDDRRTAKVRILR